MNSTDGSRFPRLFVRGFELIVFLMALAGELGIAHAPDSRKISLALLVPLWLWNRGRRESLLYPLILARLPRVLQSNSLFWGVTASLSFVALLFVVIKSLALGFETFDTGIFHQLLWSLSQGEGFHSSISRAIDFLRDHLVLSLALLAPLYRLFDGSPLVTPMLSVVFLFGGLITLLSAFRRGWGSGGLEFGLGMFAVLLSHSIWSNLSWGFHENHLGFFSICVGLAIWVRAGTSLRRTSYLGSLFAFTVAAFSKESLLLQMGTFLIVWGLFDPLEHFRRGGDRVRRSIAVSFGVLVLVVFVAYANAPKHVEKNYFANYFGYLGVSLEQVIFSLLTSPNKVLVAIGWQPILSYLFWLLAAGGFFVLHTPRSRVHFLLIPLLLPVGMAFVAQYGGLRNPAMHYVLEVLPLMWFIALWHLSKKTGQVRSALIWFMLTLYFFGATPVREIRLNFSAARDFSELREVLRSIPRERIVMADAAPGVWLSDRKWILTWWPSLEGLGGRCPDLYVVFAPDGPTRDRRIEEMQKLGAQCSTGVQREFRIRSEYSRAGFEFYEPI